jgi:DNA-binding transcriptional MerR regulator
MDPATLGLGRSAKGTRQYSAIDLEIARLTQHFRELDVPLDTIAAIAKERRCHATGDSSSQAIDVLLSTLAEHLSAKAERSLALHRIIVDASKIVRACKGCRNPPGPGTCPDCPMNETATENAVAAMIWYGDQA